jgi:thiosulfate dehydrogenase
MTTRHLAAVVGTCLVLLYGSAIFVGVRTRDLSTGWWGTRVRSTDWQPPRLSALPHDAAGASVRRGAALFNETPLYAADHVGGKISCSHCHAAGGIQPFASPMVGLPKLFPQFNARAGHIISLQDRIQECFVRSENGKPLDYNGETMKAFVDYITWLSQPEPGHDPFRGRGLVKLPALTPDPQHGEQIYTAHCAGCHGPDGNGHSPVYPAVWGPNSFNDGAGMNQVPKMAAFIQHNMPQNRMGMLSAQEAYDVAGFIHDHPRPAFNTAYKHF